MRVQCLICSDLYDEDVDVAAIVNCGHTFHDKCLSQWLEQSTTCPQCRIRVPKKGVIHKLFFNQADDNEDDIVDSSRLTNVVSNLKVELRNKDKKMGDLVGEKTLLQNELDKLKEAKECTERTLKMEKTSGASLRKELSQYRQQQEAATLAMEDAKQVRRKLVTLESVQNVISGLECEVQDMIKCNSDTKQLVTWCAVLKKEHSAKRAECKSLLGQVDKLKKELTMMKRGMKVKADSLAVAEDHLRHSEDDLKKAEQEVTSLKKKLSTLEHALGSPSNTATSFAHRLINESPAPMPLAKRPKLSAPLDVSGDLFSDPDCSFSPRPSPSTHMKKECQEYGTHFIKISSASSSSGALKPSQREVHDITNSLPLNMNIFKKRPGETSMLKKGYNGLGGHGRFVKPQSNPRTLQVTKKVKKAVTTSYNPKNMGKTPALPSLTPFSS